MSLRALACAAALLATAPACADESPSTRAVLDHQLALMREAIRSTIPPGEPHEQDLIELGDNFALALVDLNRLMPTPNYGRPSAILEYEKVGHPLVLFARAFSMRAEDTLGWPTAEYEKAMEALHQISAPPLFRFQAAAKATDCFSERRMTPQARDAQEVQRDALLELIAARGTTKNEPPSKLDLLMLARLGRDAVSGLPPDLAKDIVDKLAALPDVEACLRETLIGVFEVRTAWDERGDRFADHVEEKEWEGFAKHLDLAGEHLRRAWTLDRSRPDAPAQMIKLAMAGSLPEGETIEMWFDRVVRAQFDYLGAYYSLSWAMRPRWGGSHEAMDTFGAQCVASKRFDTDVPLQYLLVLHDIVADRGNLDWLGHPEVAERLDALDAGYRAARNDLYRNDVGTWRCLAAAVNGRCDDVVPLLLDPDFRFNDVYLRDLGISSRLVRRELWALSGPARERVIEADLALRAGRLNEAADIYRAVLEQCERDEDPHQRCNAIRSRLVSAELATGYLGDDWVKLPFAPQFPGWRVHSGAWMASSPSAALVGGRRAPAQLESDLDPGRRFEIRAKFSVKVKKSDRDEIGFLAQIRRAPAFLNYRGVIWYPSRDRIEVFSAASEHQPIPLPPDPKRKALQLSVQFWDNEFVVLVDGKPIHAGVLPPTLAELGTGIAIGTQYEMVGAAQFEVRDVAIRRLTTKPEALAVGGGQ